MLSCAVSINAAQVNFTGGTSSTLYINQVNAFEFNSVEYNLHVKDFALVSPEANNGEELIYLGAYQNIGYDPESDMNTIAVDLQNLNTDQAVTAGVSLVLSGGRKMTWDLTWDTSVALNSIVLFGLVDDQSLIINGSNVNLSNSSSDSIGLNIIHSSTQVCGFALPQYSDDCRTDRILGINRDVEDEWGDIVSSNNPIVNYLSGETDLKITSFNGAYEANDFVIGIETTAVPVPGAFLLFSSSLFLAFIRSKMGASSL
ncbi:MAG: hypothetical protein CL691_02480 [Cellvibrionales bacterium]|nr:hypothetical protein [Cellvibrionales bacterium]|tara:strand:+ start:6818 stop:7591 length:774 start_codon:yes stop_codon:yes gene_type:complete